jgi:DNA-binding GntR family transcriptional regulator
MTKDRESNGAGADDRSAAEQAYDAIVELILNYELRAGERTSINLLSDRLQLGRTPTKDAITRLQTEGVLSVVGRSGTTVNSVGPQEITQILALRRALEDFAADQTPGRISDEQVAALRALLSEMRDNSLAGIQANARFIKANVAFHRAIVAAAGNPFLDRFYSQLQLHLQMVTYLARRGFDRDAAERRQREHEAMVDALAAGDMPTLKALLREHTRSIEAELGAR